MASVKKLPDWVPQSVSSMVFDQPAEAIERTPPPADIPGAFNAPELCLLVDQYQPDLVREGSIAEVKLDGIRCLYIGGRLWTREGSHFAAAEHCLPVLRSIEQAFGKPMFLDGEYTEEGGFERTLAAFRSGRGNGCLWLFDAVPLDEWQSGRPSREPLRERKARLKYAMMKAGSRPGLPVGFIDHVAHVDPAIIESYARDIWANGYEGLVIKSASTLYVRKRTCDWMKVKLRTVSTVQVVDVAGCVRGGQEQAKWVLVRLPGKDSRGLPLQPMKLNVRGSLAETIWRNRGGLLNGGSIDVEHHGFTGGGNMREPVLKCLKF